MHSWNRNSMRKISAHGLVFKNICYQSVHICVANDEAIENCDQGKGKSNHLSGLGIWRRGHLEIISGNWNLRIKMFPLTRWFEGGIRWPLDHLGFNLPWSAAPSQQDKMPLGDKSIQSHTSTEAEWICHNQLLHFDGKCFLQCLCQEAIFV